MVLQIIFSYLFPRLVDAYIRQWIESLFGAIACRLFNVNCIFHKINQYWLIVLWTTKNKLRMKIDENLFDKLSSAIASHFVQILTCWITLETATHSSNSYRTDNKSTPLPQRAQKYLQFISWLKWWRCVIQQHWDEMKELLHIYININCGMSLRIQPNLCIINMCYILPVISIKTYGLGHMLH